MSNVETGSLIHFNLVNATRPNDFAFLLVYIAVKVVAKIIGSLFTGAAASCLGEAASNCKSHWKNPGKAMSCAKNFLKANKGRCAVGK
ncbi:hypothetical protein TSAR_006107 [Trichomalopsis sarcophagae]|uniref:Uncharacterized protein n=1 Tax=Trichomalopsis sarcophagae TaxID=543379 RepID=A0A232EY91_9HYME|nr:hypothetical protein TSAR_006107 [Trichomalopsis sarcophagae]